jgi:predicted RNA-binding Zn ribbon-like protein
MRVMSDSHEREPAPEGLALVQDLVNTLDIEKGEDSIAAPAALADWLIDHGFDAGTAVTDTDVARFADIREGLRSLLDAHNGGAASPQAVTRMNAALAGAGLTLRIGDGHATLDGARGSDRAIAQVGQAVLTAEADGTWQRLKTCRDEECRWAFYDASRNRSGVWCNMAVCGCRTKVRAFRSRRAESTVEAV